MARELKYNSYEDLGDDNIMDNVANNTVKIFPYLMVNANKADYFLGDGVTAIVSISQSGIKTLNSDGSLDALVNIGNSVNLDSQGAAILLGKKLTTTRTINMQLSKWVSNDIDKVTVGDLTFHPVVFTIGIPLDIAKYDAGEQPVFVMSSFTEALPYDDFEENDRALDNNGIYNISAINSTVLENNFKYAKIKYYLGNIDTNLGADPLILTMPNTGLIGRVTAKGEISNIKTDISFETNSKLFPIKLTPVDINQFVTVSADWFDYDNVMPWGIAKLFKTPQPISILKQIKIDGAPVIEDTELNAIIDMLGIASGFGNVWKDVLRTKGTEKDWDGAKQNIGKIMPNTFIGTVKFPIPGLEGQDPIKAIDNVYETYLRTVSKSNNNAVKSKVIKEIICALSRFIYSSYAIGKGQNSFNEVYLPWFLEPSSALELDISEKGDGYSTPLVYLLKTANFQLASRYFEFSNSLTNIDDTVNISDIKLIQSDRKLTLPSIPLQISEQNKLPLPGDISTNSSSALLYNWYIPRLTDIGNENFMTDALSITAGTTQKTLTNYLTEYNPNPTKPYSALSEDAQKQVIINDIITKYGPVIKKEDIEDFTIPNNSIITTPISVSNNKLIITPIGGSVTAPLYRFSNAYDTSLYVDVVCPNDKPDLQELKTLSFDSANTILSVLVSNKNKALIPMSNVVIKYQIFITPLGSTADTINVFMSESITSFTYDLEKDFTKKIYTEAFEISSIKINNFPVSDVFSNKNILFNKLSFEEQILTSFSYEQVPIKLIEKKKREITKIQSITISSLFTNFFSIKVGNNDTINILSINKMDETISQQTIVFL